MRISSRGYADLIKNSLSRPSQRLGKLYVQVTSGKRLQGVSDDPVAATRVVRAHNALTELDSRRFVISDAKRLLGGADGALGDVGEVLSSCYDLALRAMNASLSDAERLALAQEVRSHSASLVDAGNLTVQNAYVFSGTRTETMPFADGTAVGLPVAYEGNHQQLVYQTSPSQTVSVGFTGAQVFNYPDAAGARPVSGTDADVFSLLQDLADSIESDELGRVEVLAPQVKACHEHVVSLRGQTGVMVQRCDAALQNCDSAETRLRELLSDDEDLDMTAAIVALSNEETAYKAVMGMTSRLLALPNLFGEQW
jgi:flagellar hook-associated protein 3 FlgL